MAIIRRNRSAIVGRVGLLGASAGIVLGLIEAACLRLTELPAPLMKPHVAPSFWFFSPLLASVTFGLLGLLAGCLAALPSSRFLGMVIIAAFAGMTGAYLALVLRFSQSGGGGFNVLLHFISPAILFTVVFAWTLAALWSTRKPGSPLGFMSALPFRRWSWVVMGIMTMLGVIVGGKGIPQRFSGSTAHAMAKSPSPNIVLIVWDTARADHFSSYGYFRNTTPNLDQFAKRGVLFENAISASSWTLPATDSLFTGLLPHQHGAGTERANEPRTLAEILRADGYETVGFNANPYYGVIPWGLGRGFEDYTDSSSSMGYSFDATRIGGEFIEPLSQRWFHRSRFYQFTAHQLNEQVYSWFDRRSDRPFFLFLNYNDAHRPYEAPSPYNHLYGRESNDPQHLLLTSNSGSSSLPPGEREESIAAYDGCLSYIDSQLGELLSFLEHSPEWSNTYVIITADHGEALGEHDTYGHGTNLYREVLHVPLIVAGPGIPTGVRVTDIAKTRQIFSTALDLAGVKRSVLHHSSLTRFSNPGYVPSNPDEPAISEIWGYDALPGPQGMISITTREWQFIYRPGCQRSRLYHWPTDPLEQQNLADLPEYQTVVEHLRASVLSIVKRSYRPWRDTGYLVALTSPDFSPALEALKPVPSTPAGAHHRWGIGAAQAHFPPDPQDPPSADKVHERELLESLPYNAP